MIIVQCDNCGVQYPEMVVDTTPRFISSGEDMSIVVNVGTQMKFEVTIKITRWLFSSTDKSVCRQCYYTALADALSKCGEEFKKKGLIKE